MTRTHAGVLVALALAGLPHPGHAQVPTAAVVASAPTLESVLRQTPLGPGRCALAVGADALRLPSDAALPAPSDGLAGIADAFGRLSRPFGEVTALAPPTMTVLNTDLHDPQIYADLQTGEALKLLCGSLTEAQWSLLTGERGLGQSDLTDPAQRSLFQACLHTSTLKVLPEQGGPELDLTSDLPLARLRLTSSSQIELPVSDHEWRGGGNPDAASGTPHYILDRYQPPRATVAGVPVKAEIPNAPKQSGLDFHAPVLQVPIPLDGLKTVADLVYRIGRLTKTELYVDPHYAGRSLTVIAGTAQTPATANAADLLRALAFCLTGAYRQVGPANVLTDDILGVGTRRQRLSDFAGLAHQMRAKALEDAGDALVMAHHGPNDLRAFGDAGQAPTADQRKKGQPPGVNMDTGLQYLNLSFADLTPAQKAAAQAISDAGAKEPVQGDAQHPPSLAGTLLLVTQPKLELIVPSLPGGIDMGAYDLYDLFRPSQKVMNEREAAQQKAAEADAKAAPAKPALPPTPAPTLAQVLAGAPRRAALVDARTPAEIDAAVAAMRTIGLNQLWLPVFTDGKARIPGTPFSGPPGATDVLAEALRATKGTGIGVFPVVDLLTWGADAPADERDLTVRGEDTAQQDARRAALITAMGVPGPALSPASPGHDDLAVSPFSQSVRQSLQTLIAAIGATPGIAGIVWRDTATPGYASVQPQQDGALGYSLDGRLAYLRTAHADPVDVGESEGNIDSTLPNWDGGPERPPVTWPAFRVGADEDLLRALWAAWPGDMGAKPILVQQRLDSWQGDWFGSWDGPHAPLPAFHSAWDHTPGQPQYPDDPARQAKLQSRLALLHVDGWAASNLAMLAFYLADKMKKPWDGFVLVYDEGGIRELQSLASSLKPKPAPKGEK